MSSLKAQLRAQAFNELGQKLDDAREQAEVVLHQHEGTVVAFQESAKIVGNLLPHVDAAIEKGDLDLEQGKLAKLWLSRAINALESRAVNASNNLMAARGRLEGAQRSVETAKKLFDAEAAKIRPVAEDAPEEPSNGHPGVAIKDERNAEGA